MDDQNIRHAARAIIMDGEGRIAILAVNNGEYFKIPGGGVEAGESSEEAVRREAREEAGCELEILEKIGEREFQGDGYINHSICYLARKVGADGIPNFTDKEKSQDFELRWVTPEEALGLFNGAKPQPGFHSKMNERDKGFVMDAYNKLTSGQV